MQNPFIFQTMPLGLADRKNAAGETERIRRLQQALNDTLGTQLSLDGVMSFRTRRAIRDFQRQKGLPVDGIVTKQIESALGLGNRFGLKNFAPPSAEMFDEREYENFEAGGSNGSGTLTPIEDRTAITAKKYGHLRKGKRKKVWALVLHHTAGTLKERSEDLDHVNSHFVITPKGRILQLHPIESLLWASNGFNAGSVAVEFVGNFRNEKGMCWYPKLIPLPCSQTPTPNQLKRSYFNKNGKCGYYGGQMKSCSNTPTAEQIKAGRDLIRYLIKKIGLTHVLAHRQSSGTREGDPGPDIWYHVGQWAVDNLKMTDGGPGFRIDSGNPIPDSWRNWGKPGRTNTQNEFYDFEFEEEINRQSAEYGRWIQQSLNKILGLRLVVDGIVGTQTRSAVRSFQQQQGLTVDGIVGPVTEGALIRAGASQPPQQGSGSSPAPYIPPTKIPKSGAVPSGSPVSGGRVTSPFGMRIHPITGERTPHSGMDIGGLPIGTRVNATAAGRVVFAAMNGNAGNNVKIDHGNGYLTSYMHLDSFAVSNGQSVSRGQKIGGLGQTGGVTGPHLHYEVRLNGTAIDPAPFVNG